jgi:uncharacterized membrane protein
VESKAKILGHPILQILIPFPIGLLSASVVFDVVHLLTGNGKWSEISFWMIAAGVIGGGPAAAARASRGAGMISSICAWTTTCEPIGRCECAPWPVLRRS